MPEMDGFEVLEKMSIDKLCEKTVKIILSNKSQQSDIDRGNSLECQGIL